PLPPHLSLPLFPYTTLFRSYWRTQHSDNFDTFFDDALRSGVVPQSGFSAQRPALRSDFQSRVADHPASSDANLELVFVPDPRIGDRKSTRLNSSHRTISYAV